MRQVVYALLAIIAGLIMLSSYIGQDRENRLIRRYGVAAVAQPITRYTERRHRGYTTYSVELRFVTRSEREMVVPHGVSKRIIDRFVAGQRVTLHYLPSDPSKVLVDGDDGSEGDWLLPLLGVAALIYGGYGLYSKYREAMGTA
ncbi:DUF3592 domain-containing protein [Chitinivorax sp. PXF-14]|uniref:DUF3592 domain-containing protein n=1 Tax=Chitinivorax sp. PXF-14 TaxID=3230488 RepID=UPI0034676C4D